MRLFLRHFATKKAILQTALQPAQTTIPPTTLKGEILNLQQEAFGHVLFVQVGSFYELYDYCENFVENSSLLQLTISTDSTNGKRAGFPLSHLNRNVSTLLSLGKTVAIAEQYSRDNFSIGKNFIRKITRFVTPGTPLHNDESDVACNVASVFLDNGFAGVAWADVNTGEISLNQVPATDIISEISHIFAKEVVFSENLDKKTLQKLVDCKKTCNLHLTRKPHDFFDTKVAISLFNNHVNNSGIQEEFNFKKPAQVALGSLLRYLDELFCGARPFFKPIDVLSSSRNQYMRIDDQTSRGLELFKTSRGEFKGSLFTEINKTVTSLGSRLLSKRLRSPSTIMCEIRNRHDLIDLFFSSHICDNLIDSVRTELRVVKDLERFIQKLHNKTARPKDLNDAINSFKAVANIKNILTQNQPKRALKSLNSKILAKLNPQLDLIRFYEHVFSFNSDNFLENETHPMRISDILSKSKSFTEDFQISHGIDPALDAVISEEKMLINEFYQLQNKLAGSYGIEITLAHDPKDGPIVSVSSGTERVKHAHLRIQGDAKAIVIHRQKHQSRKRFRHSDWTILYEKMMINDAKKSQVTTAILSETMQKFIAIIPEILTTSQAIAEIDVSSSMAQLSKTLNYTRPIMTDEFRILL